ncbi:MAG: hypothetical protein JSR58_03420 [Verrucomicrobia bacterium]|nr:hypothetical protein [Verrucomicrobiota bacterium]
MLDKVDATKTSNFFNPIRNLPFSIDRKVTLLFTFIVVGGLVYYLTRSSKPSLNDKVTSAITEPPKTEKKPQLTNVVPPNNETQAQQPSSSNNNLPALTPQGEPKAQAPMEAAETSQPTNVVPPKNETQAKQPSPSNNNPPASTPQEEPKAQTPQASMKAEETSQPFQPLDFRLIKTRLEPHLKLEKGLLFSTATDKGTLFKLAINAFNKKKLPNNISIHRLEGGKNVYSPEDIVRISKQTSVLFTPDFFKMTDSESTDSIQYFPDFAVDKLGGSCFGVRFTQEERLVTACPNLADYIAKNTETLVRTGNDPMPLLAKNVWFLLDIPNNILGHGKGLERVKVLEKPFKIDVLAMALDEIPHSQRTMKGKAKKERVQLIVDTMMKAFALAKENTPPDKRCKINGGKLDYKDFGYGCFGHDPRIVGVAQMLAAYHLGIDLTLHGYNSLEEQKTRDLWDKIAPAGKTFKECIELLSTMGQSLTNL